MLSIDSGIDERWMSFMKESGVVNLMAFDGYIGTFTFFLFIDL